MLRKAESVYYLEAIRLSSSSSSKVDIPAEVANLEKNSSEKVLPSSGNPPKATEQPREKEKEVEVMKGVAFDATKPPIVSKDPIKDNEAPGMEIVLTTLPIPTMGDPKGTDQGSSEAVAQQSKAFP